MTPPSRSSSSKSAPQAESYEIIMRKWHQKQRGEPSSSEDEARLLGHEEDTELVTERITDMLEQASAEWDQKHIQFTRSDFSGTHRFH